MQKPKIIHIYKDAPITGITNKRKIIYFEPRDCEGTTTDVYKAFWSANPKDYVKLVYFNYRMQGFNVNPNSILDDYIMEKTEASLLVYYKQEHDTYAFVAFPIESAGIDNAMRAAIEYANQFPPKVRIIIPPIGIDESQVPTPPGREPSWKCCAEETSPTLKTQRNRDVSREEMLYEEFRKLKRQFGANFMEIFQEIEARENENIDPPALEIDENGDFFICYPEGKILLNFSPLQKVLYILLIRHKKGLPFPELRKCSDEALNIYMALKKDTNAFPVGVNKNGLYGYAKEVCRLERSVFALLGGGEYRVPEYFRRLPNIDVFSKEIVTQLNKNVTGIRKEITSATQGRHGLSDFFTVRSKDKYSENYSVAIGGMPDKLIWKKSKRFPTNIFDPSQDNTPYYSD